MSWFVSEICRNGEVTETELTLLGCGGRIIGQLAGHTMSSQEGGREGNGCSAFFFLFDSGLLPKE